MRIRGLVLSALLLVSPCFAQTGEKVLNQLTPAQLNSITKQVDRPALTDAQVDAAISLGTSDKHKDGGDIGVTLADMGQRWANAAAAMGQNGDTSHYAHSGFGVRLFSPSEWITWQAHEAKRYYMNYTLADATVSDRLQVLRVIATPDTPDSVVAGGGMLASSSVENVVLRSSNGKGVSQPLSLVPYEREAKNAMGGNAMYNGMVAIFSMDDVAHLRASDEHGEFLVTVIGEDGKEKSFKLKEKNAQSFN